MRVNKMRTYDTAVGNTRSGAAVGMAEVTAALVPSVPEPAACHCAKALWCAAVL